MKDAFGLPCKSIRTHYSEVYNVSRRNARQRQIPFLLSRPEFDNLVALADGRCMLSGVDFCFDPAPLGGRRPYKPSIDRIDNAGDYTADNCRLVCAIVNIAMNEWGLEPLIKVARNLVAYAEQLAVELRRGPVELQTVAEFYFQNDIPRDVRAMQRLAAEAGAMCDYGGIDRRPVERLDPLTGKVKWLSAYPPSILVRAHRKLQRREAKEAIAS